MIINPIGTASLSKREILRFLSVASQTIFPPVVTSLLYLYIFGVALGHRVDFSYLGLSYLDFIIPGIMTMHLIASSYENTSSSLFIARWHNHIQEVLLAPLSYLEMVLGLLAGGVARGVIVTSGVYIVASCFTTVTILHPFIFLYFVLTIAVIFSCAGMIGALWAEDFSMLSLWNIYLIMPAIFMGGVFYPLQILPRVVQIVSVFNPMYYLVSGMRYSLTSLSDVSLASCAVFSFFMALISFFATVYLFKIGYKLRT